MKDSYRYRVYKCKKCTIMKSDYCWDSQVLEHKTKCPECGKQMTYDDLVIKEKQQLTSIRTETKNR